MDFRGRGWGIPPRPWSKGGTAVRTMRGAVLAVVVAVCLGVTAVALPAGAQSGSGSNKKTLYVIGAFETKGESSQAIPHYDDGVKLAVKDLERKGWDVTYERIAASGTVASSQEQAFLAAQAKNPDIYMAL